MERYGKKEIGDLSRVDEFLLSMQLTRCSVLSRIGVFAFSGIFFAGGAAILGMAVLKPIAGSLKALDWIQTDARIIQSELVRDGESSEPLIRYTYSFRGDTYEGSRVSWSNTKRNFGIREMKDTLTRYPVGKEITIWHDPSNPSESIINRSAIGLRLETFLFPIPFLLVGICGVSYALFGGWVAARTRRLMAAIADQADGIGFHELGQKLRNPSRQTNTSEKIIFTMAQSRTEGLAILFAAIFWNGIVGVFLGVLFTMIASGEKMAIFLGLFLIPFVAIGALLIYVTAAQFWTSRPPAFAIAFSGLVHTRLPVEITVEWMPLRNARNPSGASIPTLRLERGTANSLPRIRKRRISPYGGIPGGLPLEENHGTQTIFLEAAEAKTSSNETDIEAILTWRDGMGSGEKHVAWTILQRIND